jgi:hypothetical protein
LKGKQQEELGFTKMATPGFPVLQCLDLLLFFSEYLCDMHL